MRLLYVASLIHPICLKQSVLQTQMGCMTFAKCSVPFMYFNKTKAVFSIELAYYRVRVHYPLSLHNKNK